MLDSRKGGALAHFILSAAAAMGELQIATRGMAPAIDYGSPRFGRHNNQRTSTGPGKSPAMSGPHPEPQVHVRSPNGVHYWFKQNQWRPTMQKNFGQPGDVVERVNGYGQVTKRVRVPR